MDDLSPASLRYGNSPSRGENSYTSLHSATLTISGAEMKDYKYYSIRGNCKRANLVKFCYSLAVLISWIESISVKNTYTIILCKSLFISIREYCNINLNFRRSSVAKIYSSCVDGPCERFDGVVSVFLISDRVCNLFSVICNNLAFIDALNNASVEINLNILIIFDIECERSQFEVKFCGEKL